MNRGKGKVIDGNFCDGLCVVIGGQPSGIFVTGIGCRNELRWSWLYDCFGSSDAIDSSVVL